MHGVWRAVRGNPGLLLLWRRTATIGAVMVIAVMTNVVMLNLSYDPRARGRRVRAARRRPALDHLVIDGLHLGKVLHVALHAAPDPLLVTRGFHWINEQPLSR